MSATREAIEGYAPAITPGSPGGGRVFRSSQVVRLGDVGVDGRLRLDGLARYAQDVASDDVRAVGLDGRWGWVVRRTSMVVRCRPCYEQEVTLATWCAALGAAWAERRTTLFVEGRPAAEVSGVWVCLDRRHRHPVALDREFLHVYGPSAGQERVSRRLLHPDPPGTVAGRAWALRNADYDAFGHVNNAALWAVVDDELARRHPGRAVAAASLEHREAIGPDVGLRVSGADDGAGGLGLWLSGPDGALLATAMVRFGD